MIIKAKDMTPEQANHKFCSFCNYRLMVAGQTYWGCSLDEAKKEELCSYERAMKEEEKEEESGAAH